MHAYASIAPRRLAPEAPVGQDPIPIDTIVRQAIRDLDSEITDPSALGASLELVADVRDRLARVLSRLSATAK